MRYAMVSGARSGDEVAAYLPRGYEVYGHRFPNGPTGRIVVLICGEDDAGWTLDDYVIPRLASGLMGCKEIISDDQALNEINLLLSAAEWPGASGMEDVNEIVLRTGREEVANAPEWRSH